MDFDETTAKIEANLVRKQNGESVRNVIPNATNSWFL